MLFDAEDQQLGLNMSNISFHVGFNTDGRSKSSELIRLPKIIENNCEDDTTLSLSMWNSRVIFYLTLKTSLFSLNLIQKSNNKKFITRMDNIENQITPNTNLPTIIPQNYGSRPTSVIKGSKPLELTIEERSDDSEKSSDECNLSIQLNHSRGKGSSRLSNRKKNSDFYNSSNNSGLTSPRTLSLKKLVCDEIESFHNNQVTSKVDDNFDIIEENVIVETECEENEDLVKHFREKHKGMKYCNEFTEKNLKSEAVTNEDKLLQNKELLVMKNPQEDISEDKSKEEVDLEMD